MQPSRRLVVVVLLVVLGQPLCATGAEDRILVDVQINSQPARLQFDTGAGSSFIFREAADRLGLKTFGMVVAECALTLGNVSQKATFEVVDSPCPSFEGNLAGCIGWPAVSNRVIEIDVEQNKCRVSLDSPSGLQGWTKWDLVTNSPILVFERGIGIVATRIGIDTGCPDGVMLNSDHWMRWRKERAGRPATIQALMSVEGDLFPSEMLRAKKVAVGDLRVMDMPVAQMSPSLETAFRNCDAVLGLFAFRRLKITVDGKNGAVYTRPLAHPAGRYDYNRLGAVFVPADLRISEELSQIPDLVAHVVNGGPASRAGIQNGDVLLKFGNHDASEMWRGLFKRTETTGSWPPAGTKVKLTLRRNGRHYETTVTLRDLSATN